MSTEGLKAGELTPEQISEMRKQLEAKKKEIEEERKRIAQRREQRALLSDSPALSASSSSLPLSMQSDSPLNSPPSEERGQLTRSMSNLTLEADSVTSQLRVINNLSNNHTFSLSGKEDLTFKVERVQFDMKRDYMIRFSLILNSTSVRDEVKEVSFEFNILEDTVFYVARDLSLELHLHDKYDQVVQNLLTFEVDRLVKEREVDKRRDLLYRAQMLESVKRYSEAEFCYNTLKELLEEMDDFSSTHNDTRQAIHLGLGHIEYKENHFAESRNNYEQFLLLESRKSLPGLVSIEFDDGTPKKPAVDSSGIPYNLRAFIGLAKVHAKEKNYKQAESILKGVLLDQGESDQKPAAELIRDTLVKIYEQQNKFYEAENVFKRLYDTKNHTFTTLESQAEKLIQAENLQEAQVLFKQALEMKESTLPVLEKLALLYVKHNKYAEAMESLGNCLEMKQKLRDPEHFTCAETLCHMGKVHVYQSRWEEAEESFVKAMKIGEKALQSNENLLSCSVGKGKEEIAKINARNSEIKKALTEALNGLIDLLTELMRNDDAAVFKKRLADISKPTSGH
eukprot:TRINITY_DN4214_c0_g1_i1.p1 TRINITY_DN4214_c0_g1~~TRINITY_DN4214_c0_g1_i1.p1  ORF type:complete len:567 (+),score=212.50 TRINITY_DN4214_c0_g1_i1:139-1839(+)